MYYNSSNYDFLGNYATTLAPIVGIDLQTGGAPIELRYLDKGRWVYPQPRVRLNYFTVAEAAWFADKLTKDIGDHFKGMEISSTVDTSKDPQNRSFYYVNLQNGTEDEVERVTLLRIASLMWAGLDVNGNSLFDQKEYVLGVNESYENPGKFSWDDKKGLQYVPQRRN